MHKTYSWKIFKASSRDSVVVSYHGRNTGSCCSCSRYQYSDHIKLTLHSGSMSTVCFVLHVVRYNLNVGMYFMTVQVALSVIIS